MSARFLAIFILPVLLGAAPLPYGARRLPDGNLEVGACLVRTAAGELVFPGRFVLTSGALEVIVALPHGRLHEALLVTEVHAVQIQALLYLLGAENGFRLATTGKKQGDRIDILIEWQDAAGQSRRDPVENWISDTRTGKNLLPQGWIFVGSPLRDGHFTADLEGNVVINYSVGSTVLDTPEARADTDDTLHIVDSSKEFPVEGAQVQIVFKPHKQQQDKTKK